MHETSSRLLRMTDDERPFTNDFNDLFCALAVSLPLTPHRVRFRLIDFTFTSDEAITNLGSLKVSRSSRMPDPKDSSRMVTTTTTTTFSMGKDMARSVCRTFLEAKFIESVDGKLDFSNKSSVWQLTPKGIHILERFCSRNGIQSAHVRAVIGSDRNPHQLVFLERDTDTDKLYNDEQTIKIIFRRFSGTTANESGPSDANSGIHGFSKCDVGVRMMKHKPTASRPYGYTFNGKNAAEWLMDCCTIVDRRESIEICSMFLQLGLIAPVDSQTSSDKIQPWKQVQYYITPLGERVAGWAAPDDASLSANSNPVKARDGAARDSNSNRTNVIIHNPSWRLLYREFLRETMCEENLSFYLEAQEFNSRYKQTMNTTGDNKIETIREMLATAYELYNAFLAPGSPNELNIDHALRKQLATRMTRAAGDDTAMKQSFVEVALLFEEAQNSIFKLMSSNSTPIFLKHPKYGPLLRGLDNAVASAYADQSSASSLPRDMPVHSVDLDSSGSLNNADPDDPGRGSHQDQLALVHEISGDLEPPNNEEISEPHLFRKHTDLSDESWEKFPEIPGETQRSPDLSELKRQYNRRRDVVLREEHSRATKLEKYEIITTPSERRNPDTIDGCATFEDGSFPEDGSISDRGGSSLAGTTLVETQAQATEPEQASIAEHEKEGNDYMSIVSNDEDIASQAPRRKTEQELLAVKLFSSFFAELEDLRALHEDLLKKLGTARFVENYRRSFKVYVLKLREEAQTALEKDIVKIIENHENRRSMALRIMDYMGQEDIDYRKRFDYLALQPLKKQLLEDWAKNTYGPPDLAPEAADLSGEESEDEASDGNGDLETNHLKTVIFTNLDKARNFLRKDTPLQTLILQLRLLALPPSLREIMETTPKHTIRISDKNDISLMNKCKTFVETCTATQWDWWPLRPRVPDLTPGQLRLEWEFCGETLYADISPQEAISIKQILTTMSEHPPECHCCKVRLVQLDWTTAFQHIHHLFRENVPIKTASPSAGITPSSKAYLRYSPAGTTGPNSSSSLPHGTPSLSPQSNFPSGNVGTQAHIGGVSNNTPVNSLWVVFGIKDMRGFLNIENIETHTHLNDPSFFQELKLRHRSHCWCFQRWFSPYRFRYCRFVQFEELLNEHVSCIGEALPDEHGYTSDYEYNPRPPSATIPLIDPVRFSILLSACNSLCYWSLLPAFLHKCRQIPADRRYLTRIPRKKGVYNAASRAQTPNLNSTDRIAFGIEAGYLPSYAFLFLYHVILILSGFSFWIYWMKHHPADLQNASVPLFTVIMLIGTFWGVFGKRMGAS